MKPLIVIFIVVGIAFGGWKIWDYWKTKEAEEAQRNNPAVESKNLPGMPSQLEGSLTKAQSGGAKSLKAWLDAYGRSVQDPRLASIQLDYVLLIGRENPSEARRIFADVKKRTPSNSPVSARIKQLEPTYE
ncbi:MAG TPA: hypothetical protein VJ063_14550 [Verrucomicrobiae bacterium]|nr:hypothetical protein [Verrucomicrobiae bacterium]